LSDAANAFDAPVPGFVGPDGDGISPASSPLNFVNPLFFGWADGWVGYSPAPGVGTSWQDPDLALGTATGDNLDVVSLGDLDATQIANGGLPGTITLAFSQPIRNKTGADFATFENGFVSGGGAGVAGQITAELGYVEVSSDGVHFARMPCASLTPAAVGAYGTVNATDVFGLAGKHANAYGESWATPFDLSWLADDPLVTGGQVNLDAIIHIRIVDIPGNGTFTDSNNNPIYDAWLTYGSGGVDLEAVGVISRDMDFETWQDQRGLAGAQLGDLADPDEDGLPNLIEYATARLPDRADSAPVTALSMDAGRLVLTFDRDERATDLVYAVEASSDLSGWTVIAQSAGGSPVTGFGGHSPAISETSASTVASVGVLRRVSVTDTQTTGSRRFLRLRVSRL